MPVLQVFGGVLCAIVSNLVRVRPAKSEKFVGIFVGISGYGLW